MLSNSPMQKCIPKEKLAELSSSKAGSIMADIFLNRRSFWGVLHKVTKVSLQCSSLTLKNGFSNEPGGMSSIYPDLFNLCIFLTQRFINY